jgi:hypothetical protein
MADRTPIVYEDEATGLLRIEWPNPRPASFEISAEAFEALVVQANVGRTGGR